MIDAEVILACSDADLVRLRVWLDRLQYALALRAVPPVVVDRVYFRYERGQPKRHPRTLTMRVNRRKAA